MATVRSPLIHLVEASAALSARIVGAVESLHSQSDGAVRAFMDDIKAKGLASALHWRGDEAATFSIMKQEFLYETADLRELVAAGKHDEVLDAAAWMIDKAIGALVREALASDGSYRRRQESLARAQAAARVARALNGSLDYPIGIL